VGGGRGAALVGAVVDAGGEGGGGRGRARAGLLGEGGVAAANGGVGCQHTGVYVMMRWWLVSFFFVLCGWRRRR